MNVEPVILTGRTVRIEPLTLEHAPALHRHYAPELFSPMVDWPEGPELAAFVEWERRGREMPASVLFVVLLAGTGEPVGSTSYLDIRPAHRGLEIGRTWIALSHQGTRVNPESKYLLLRHAFETLGAMRVQLKTDLRNLRSQRAIEKLGAQREGVFRKYQCRANGTFRDTVVYSLIDQDWPAARARLEERLGGDPTVPSEG
ncbi:MAG TPA: GNAT family protein [Thermoanaerobaculia bacterium]|nr:GNAT family protein [Thermoanaerobaculia bacterium]